MLRTILLLTVVAALSHNSATAQILRETPAPALAARIASLGAEASGWRLNTLRAGGPLNSLRGEVVLSGDTPQERSLDFVARHGALFGVVPAVVLGEPRVLARFPSLHTGSASGGSSAPRALRMPQLIQGAELSGYGLTLEFDAAGDFVQAHGVVSEFASALPGPTVLAVQAIETALQHLAAQGHGIGDLRAGPSASLVARVAADGPHLLHSVQVVLRRAAQPYAVEIDAHDGSVFALRDLAQHGTGTYHFDGQQAQFKTRNGKGTIYKSLKHAKLGKASNGRLAEVSRESVVTGLAEDGFLFGRWVALIDDKPVAQVADAILFNAKHDWRSFTDDPQGLGDVSNPDAAGQSFDHTNTYHWMTTTARYLEKVFGPLAIDYSVPVVVNVEGLINAFFTSGDLGLGHGPGYFAFGDVDVDTNDFQDDFSRDPTIVSHEFTHGVVGKFGLGFGSNELDTPPRALSEAVADYFAASMHKTPCVGAQFMTSLGPKLGLSGDCMRDLSEVRRMPDDLFQMLGQGGLPEEHEAGIIFGGSLYRVGKALGRKKGDAAIADALFSFPQSTDEVGIQTVTPDNALEAYQAYFAVALWALLDGVAEKLPSRLVGKALGAAMELGAVGDITAGSWWLADLSGGGKLGYKSMLMPGISNHSVGIAVSAGQATTIKLKGIKGTQLDIDLGLAQGAVAPPDDPVVNAAGTSITWKNIVATEDTILVLTVIPESVFGGPYKTLVKVK